MNRSVHVPLLQPEVPAALAAFEHKLRSAIPLAGAMAVSVERYDGGALTLRAPLAPNLNDKGCAFGGSLASVMTLAGWGLVQLALDGRGLACDLYVQDSSIRYRAPVWQDFSATARLEDGEGFDDFFAVLAARGRSRVRVRVAVPLPDGGEAATLEARFVALKH